MKILYIHQYFKTPSEPGGTRSYWVARKLIERKHRVTVLTSKNNLAAPYERITLDGMDVIYINVNYSNNMNILQRANAFLKFMFLSTKFALLEKNIDMVISTSTPLTVGFPAIMLKKLKGTKFLFEVRDLWPEVPIQMGAIKNSFLKMLVRSFEKSIYNNSEHIVALSPGMIEGVLKTGINPSKVTMIPNMSKIDEFYPRQKNIKLCHELGLNERSFKIVHFGTLGIANGVKTIIDSAALLKNESLIEFVFLGGGSTESELKKICRDEGIDSVHFLGNYPMTLTSEIVNLCDVSLVSFLDLPILYTNSPNKLFDSLSAGKPIIVNSAGWTKKLVEDYHCGLYVNPTLPEDLAEKIVYLKNNPEVVTNMGTAARVLAETKYDKSILCEEFADIIESKFQHV